MQFKVWQWTALFYGDYYGNIRPPTYKLRIQLIQVHDQAECVEDLPRDMLHSVTTTIECNATSLEQAHNLVGLQQQDDLQANPLFLNMH